MDVASFRCVHLFLSGTSLTPSSINSGKYLGALPEFFPHDTNLGELIMPTTCVHVTHCHSLQIVVRVPC